MAINLEHASGSDVSQKPAGLPLKLTVSGKTRLRPSANSNPTDAIMKRANEHARADGVLLEVPGAHPNDMKAC